VFQAVAAVRVSEREDLDPAGAIGLTIIIIIIIIRQFIGRRNMSESLLQGHLTITPYIPD